MKAVRFDNQRDIAELAGLVAEGRVEVPIERANPPARVRDAYRELSECHAWGKIVLCP